MTQPQTPSGVDADITVAGATGTPVGSVEVSIDYAIIQHFSEHLYGSPNKAVEELVTNGYDALAQAVYVYVPGPQVDDRILVWDDGESMDIEGLQQLWWIAKSPKADGTERIARNDSVAPRKVIGKFGIGKLASYSVGHRITHLCKTPQGFLLVNIDYREVGVNPDDADTEPDGAAVDAAGDEAAETDVPTGEEAEATDSASSDAAEGDDEQEDEDRSPHVAPIVRLSEEEAVEWVEALFNDDSVGDAFQKVWHRPTWTLAVVDDLKEVSLPPGRLGWVLSTGMPLREDFSVYVNDAKIESRLASGEAQTWDLSTPDLKDALKTYWTGVRADGDVSGDMEFDVNVDLADGSKVPAIRLPVLGEVRATIRFFKESLNKGKAADQGRSYGFFVYVRGRLLNPDDAFLLLADPSFGTFYRAQWSIHADALDAELLADRERLRRRTPMASELAALQQGLYLAARSAFDKLDKTSSFDANSASLLPVDSRSVFREPFTALLVRHGDEDDGFDLSSPVVERKNLEHTDPLATLDGEVGGFAVNASHPLFQEARKRLGNGKIAQEALRVYDLFAVAERLLEGYLFDTGMTEDRVDVVMEWRDDLFRAMADRYAGAPEEIVLKARQTSYLGKKEFENALADLFRLMGFEATRDGASGVKDVLVIAPIGQDEVRFTVEGKGSKHSVTNDGAEIDIAAAHRDAVDGAEHAIVVARQFDGFKTGDDPALLKQCRAVGGVSIVTVDVLADLYAAVHRYFYPLDMILPVLAEVESPEQKKQRVAELASPVDDFDHRQLLEHAWNEQQTDAAGDVVLFRSLWQKHYKNEMGWDAFRVKVTALEALSRGLIRLTSAGDNPTGTLRQSPEMISRAIAASLKAGG